MGFWDDIVFAWSQRKKMWKYDIWLLVLKQQNDWKNYEDARSLQRN